MGNRGYNSYKWSHGPLLISGKGPRLAWDSPKNRGQNRSMCAAWGNPTWKSAHPFYTFFAFNFTNPKQTFPQKI